MRTLPATGTQQDFLFCPSYGNDFSKDANKEDACSETALINQSVGDSNIIHYLDY